MSLLSENDLIHEPKNDLFKIMQQLEHPRMKSFDTLRGLLELTEPHVRAWLIVYGFPDSNSMNFQSARRLLQEIFGLSDRKDVGGLKFDPVN